MNALFSDTVSCQSIPLAKRVFILFAEGVSLTTFSTGLEPVQQANQLLGHFTVYQSTAAHDHHCAELV